MRLPTTILAALLATTALSPAAARPGDAVLEASAVEPATRSSARQDSSTPAAPTPPTDRDQKLPLLLGVGVGLTLLVLAFVVSNRRRRS